MLKGIKLVEYTNIIERSIAKNRANQLFKTPHYLKGNKRLRVRCYVL